MILEFLVRGEHALVVADVVLRDAVLGELGDGVAGGVARDAELALKKGLGLADGFLFGGRGLVVVVVAAHEDEELGSFGLLGAFDLDVGVEKYSEGVFRVVLGGDGARDEVAEAWRFEVFVGVPNVDGHDADRRAVGEGGKFLLCDARKVLACER